MGKNEQHFSFFETAISVDVVNNDDAFYMSSFGKINFAVIVTLTDEKLYVLSKRIHLFIFVNVQRKKKSTLSCLFSSA